MSTTTRLTIQEIVKQAKDHALIAIVSGGKDSIANAFKALQAEAAELKGFDSSYVAPWEVSTPPTPLPKTPLTKADKRVYQIRNCRDALLKVMADNKHYSFEEIIALLKAEGLTYSNGTVYANLYQFARTPLYYAKKHNGWMIRMSPKAKWVESGPMSENRYYKLQKSA